MRMIPGWSCSSLVSWSELPHENGDVEGGMPGMRSNCRADASVHLD